LSTIGIHAGENIPGQHDGHPELRVSASLSCSSPANIFGLQLRPPHTSQYNTADHPKGYINYYNLNNLTITY